MLAKKLFRVDRRTDFVKFGRPNERCRWAVLHADRAQLLHYASLSSKLISLRVYPLGPAAVDSGGGILLRAGCQWRRAAREFLAATQFTHDGLTSQSIVSSGIIHDLTVVP